ncbi:MAG: methyltransferase regulatory domain-containing protein [Rhodanobacteraceae bacterium]|nr:methyltransferase regulatory domain-containing protein [Rhodanobacteraceae bacterium]
MDDWTDGYVTEVPYSVNHFPEMAPAHLRLALLQAGLAAPNTDRDFTYLELGFGQGLGLNMLAAAHPQGRFFGNDFMPAHVAAAQALADQAGLSNLQLVQDSFSQLRGRDLPPMDFIVLHGVYSWVNADNRAHIVALIARLLKPGGVVYLSYNCMPGWAHKAPLQRLMSEAAQRQSRGSALQGFHAARDLLRQLDAADAAFFANNPGARTALREIANASDAYLLHEFAPRGWTPFYCTDVAADMGRADLQFAASAKLFSNFPQWSLPPELRAVIDATEDSGMRELLRDFAMQTPLRRDVYLRSPRTLNAAEIEQEYDATLLALQRPPASCARHVRTPITALHLEDDVVDALLAALAGGPQTIAALRALPALANASPASIRETLNLMLCLGYLGPATAPKVETRGRVHALNKALLKRLHAGERLSGFVSPAHSAAVAIAYHDQLFLAAQQNGHSNPDTLASYAENVLQISTGPTATPSALPDLQREARNFLQYGDEYYRSLDLFGAT